MSGESLVWVAKGLVQRGKQPCSKRPVLELHGLVLKQASVMYATVVLLACARRRSAVSNIDQALVQPLSKSQCEVSSCSSWRCNVVDICIKVLPHVCRLRSLVAAGLGTIISKEGDVLTRQCHATVRMLYPQVCA